MKKILALLAFILLMPSQAQAFGMNLDDLYRSMLKEENEGRLPEFVINREAPQFEAPEVAPEKVYEGVKAKTLPEPNQTLPANEGVPLEILNFANPQPIKSWKDVVIAIQKGNPSPFDIAEVEKRAEAREKDAVEMLAWMKANGVGGEQNLQKAWELYSLAASLGVETAAANATAVYRAMTAYEKETFSPF